MTQTTIIAELRDRAGKGTARATRRAGNVPAVLYGNKEEPVLLAVNHKDLEALSRKSGFFTKLFELKAGKNTWQALARDAQRDPVTEQLIHVDFLRIDPKTRIRVAVPVRFINTEKSPGMKRGGALNVVLHTLNLWVAATKIPTSIDIDLTGLEINDSIHSSSLVLPEGTELAHHDDDFTVATIAAPSAIRSEMRDKAGAAAAPAADAAAAAPAAAAGAKAAAPAAKAGDAKAAAPAAKPAAKK